MHLCIYASCIYASMHICIYASMHLCIYASMHLCIYASMHLCIDASMHLCIYASMHLCIHASMHLCIYASMRLCISASMHPSISYLSVECIKAARSAAEDSSIYIYIYIYMYVFIMLYIYTALLLPFVLGHEGVHRVWRGLPAEGPLGIGGSAFFPRVHGEKVLHPAMDVYIHMYP